MNQVTIDAINEFINKIQYYIGQQGYLVSIKNKSYDTDEFDLLSELIYVLDYFDKISSTDQTDAEVIALIDFFEARYNLNNLPYIVYPKRISNILSGNGVPSSPSSSPNGIEDAPLDNILYGRKNKQWVEIPSVLSQITQTETNNWNESYSWGDHSLAGYALTSQLHNAVTIGVANGLSLNQQILSLSLATTSTNGAMSAQDKTRLDSLFNDQHDPVTLNQSNGLSLVGQALSLNLATVSSAGAMSSADKVKLNSLENHDEVTIGTSNGLSLTDQVLSLSLATTLNAGAMSSSDKVKLNSLSNYTHPSGFTNQPTAPLNGANVISQVQVNTEGHVTGVSVRQLSLTNLGVTKGSLTKQDDTNVILTLGGTPTDSLFEDVSLTLGWTGELSVERGGTGASTFTSGQILVGNGINPITTISRNGIDTRTTFPAQAHSLTSHTDVSLTNPQAGQVLIYQGGIWINSTLTSAGVSITETDPVFVAWRDTQRTANTFYSGPNGTSGIGSFRSIVREDLPNIYVRFDTNSQGLTQTQKDNVLTNIGAQASFNTGDITGDSIITLTENTSRLVGNTTMTITHADSGWVAKTNLEGAVVLSNLTVNSTGHISDWTTRILTLEDLGFVAFDPSTIESTLTDHESRIATLELNFPLLNGDKNYVHVQNTSAAIWTITHNMNKKPSVTIIDSAGSIILCKLTYIDLNVIELDFNGTLTSGEAILN